jgi:hypothetical protein
MQQTPTQSPFMGTNTLPARPNNVWGPAFLKIPGMQDQPDIGLMKAYTLPLNPNVKYDLLGPATAMSIWLPPTIYPPHWDQKHIVFNEIVKAA